MYGRSSGGSGGAPPPQVPFRAGPPGGPEPEPSGRSLLWLLIPIGLIAIALALILLARGGSDGGTNAMVEAAQKTAKISGAKEALEVTYTDEGSEKSVVGTGSGSFNAKSRRSEATLTIPIPGRAGIRVETVGNGRIVYQRSSTVADQLPPGIDWLATEPLLGRNQETAFGSGDSAQDSFQALEVVGGVEKLDQQTVRGHLTTRYKGTVDSSKAADFLNEHGEKALAKEYEILDEKGTAKVEFEVWVDQRGIARQIREIERIPLTDGHGLNMDMRMQFYDFGAKPKIHFPAKRRVIDYTPVLRAELGMNDGHSIGSLLPPAKAKALSAAAFRRRATAICRRVNSEGTRLERAHLGLLNRVRNVVPGSLTPSEAKPLLESFATRLVEPIYRIVRPAVLGLARLRPPASQAVTYHRYLVLDAQQAEWMLAGSRAMRLGEFKSPVLNRKADERAEKAQRKRLATKLGIGACEQGGTGASTIPA